MSIKTAIIIYILAKIHAKGWCKSWHRSEYIMKTSGKGECYLIDSIMIAFHPLIVAQEKETKE